MSDKINKCPKCGKFTEIIGPKEATPAKPEGAFCKKCLWHSAQKCFAMDVLGHGLMELLRMAPQNPVVRSQVLAVARKPIPDNLVEYPDIINWLEFNVERKSAWNSPFEINQEEPEVPQAEYAVAIPVRVKDIERGRCNYAVSRFGSTEFRFSEDDLVTLADGCANRDQLSVRLNSFLRSEINYEDVNMSWDDDIEYEHYAMSEDGPDESSSRFDQALLLGRAMEWLSNNRPELYRRLLRVPHVADTDATVIAPANEEAVF